MLITGQTPGRVRKFDPEFSKSQCGRIVKGFRRFTENQQSVENSVGKVENR